MVSPGAKLECAQRLAREVERVGEAGDAPTPAAPAFFCHSRNAPASVIRCAARLPESTDET